MEIKTIFVAGFGLMGRGISQTAAEHGFKVIAYDTGIDLLQKGTESIKVNLEKSVQKGKLDASQAEAIMQNIETTTDLSQAGNASFVIEAVTEDENIKHGLYKKLAEVLPDQIIIATNTSSIPITLLASFTDRPDRFIGMHFFNPVPVMKLVEIIRGLATSEQTYNITFDLAKALGKDPITCKDSPGFLVNRMLLPFINEAIYALMEGVGTPEDIDKGVKLGLNHPMGPLELADFVGLDTLLNVCEVMYKTFGNPKYAPSPLLRQMVAAGWLGRKSGRGFYVYNN